jgi:hypothetical protein
MVLFTLVACAAPNQDSPSAAAPHALAAFASDDGLARLARSTAKADFAALANQFEAQYNTHFCGPATAAIVLNAMRGPAKDLPRDRGRLRAEDLRHLPSTTDPALPRFTQDNVIEKGAKTRAQVFGEPVVVDGKPIRDPGYQIRQFDALLKAHGVATRLVIAADALPLEEIRKDLVRNLQRGGDYAVVNYRRQAVGQTGGGHISPVGAYDAVSDSFLVLDVNPTSAAWVWMPTATLVNGMRTFDTVENRGYVLVGEAP